MPLNASPEFAQAHKRYLSARTRKEKISALEEMIKTCPKHKGAEKLLKQLKQRLAKLKAQKISKPGRTGFCLRKEGDVQIVIVGPTQSGKSSLLAKLTNARPEISTRPYTTTVPQVGVAEWRGVKFQLVEIPSTFEPMYTAIAHSADGVIFLDKPEIENKLSHLPSIKLPVKPDINPEKLFSAIWKELGLIRVYTKEPGKKPKERAMVLDLGSTVEDAARKLHQDFVKFFRYARVWGSSVKHGGERVGKNHILQDGDVIEIHA